MGNFFSNILQNEPKNKIFKLKIKIIKIQKKLSIDFFFQFQKKKIMDENFLSKKGSEYKFPIIFRYFFLHFQHFFTIEFFFQFSKKNFVDKFFSNLLQDKPKNKIFNLKTNIIQKNKNLSIKFFFQFKKKKIMNENFLSKKGSEYKFCIIFRYFFSHFQHFLTIEFFFQFSKKKNCG